MRILDIDLLKYKPLKSTETVMNWDILVSKAENGLMEYRLIQPNELPENILVSDLLEHGFLDVLRIE